jgi:alpha-D-ribose 1-methylphosphonate 5-triphosphate synthase subunit PhnH
VLRAAFADPVLDAQRAFRAGLNAMAHPGRVVRAPGLVDPPPPLGAAATALCLTLADLDTSVWLDPGAAAPDVVEFLRFHCGCPLVARPSAAAFAVIADPGRLAAWDVFAEGTDEEPERGATLIVQVDRLVAGVGRRLAGPGIDGEVRLSADGLPDACWRALGAAPGRFPRGIDAFLVAGDALAAIPRTTRVEG